MKWERTAGKWKGLSLRPAASQVPPSDSQYLFWASAGQLEIALLSDGDTLSQDANRKYTLNDTPLGVDHIVAADCPKDVAIKFEVESAYVRLVLLESEGSLAWLARETKSTKLCATFLNGSGVEFSLDVTAKWIARAELKPDQFPTKMSVGSRSEPFSILWSWAASSPGLFATDGKGNVVEVPHPSADPNGICGIILNSPIPAGLTVNNEWSVLPAGIPWPNGYLGALRLRDRTGDLTLREVEEAAKESPLTFLGTRYKARVNTSDWPYYQKRYYAILGNNGRVEPNLNDATRASSYGPKHPYHVGDGRKPSDVSVKRLSGPSAASHKNSSLEKGFLPAPHKKMKEAVLFIQEEDRQLVVVGILIFACEVPAGKWEPAEQLKEGTQLVSWRGLVDEAEVTSISLAEASRHVLIFKSGFEFRPEMWLAASFLGVATTKNALWWGDARQPDTSKLSYRKDDNKWLIKGRWVDIDLTVKRGTTRDAAVLTGPCALAFICTADPNDASGPILQVDPNGTSPKLIGWLADANGKVQLNGAQLGFVNELESHFTLSPQCKLEEFNGPENIKEALRSARESPNDPEGVFNRVPWRRHADGAIQAWDPTETGVYVLTKT